MSFFSLSLARLRVGVSPEGKIGLRDGARQIMHSERATFLKARAVNESESKVSIFVLSLHSVSSLAGETRGHSRCQTE